MTIPWWGWLLIGQAGFIYALFEFVRKLEGRVADLEAGTKRESENQSEN